jgi:Relaxase/Mobilisation nuclease domain.
MAVTKIFPVKNDIRPLINYVMNPEKTGEGVLCSGVNCLCDSESATREWRAVKSAYGKTGGNVAFHAIQSFMPGEVSSETAHEIGMKLAAELWGDEFEVIVATHVDKNHVHNHFAINSVSFACGKRFINKYEQRDKLRSSSDKYCREYGLNIIGDPKFGKTKQYAEWRDSKAGKTTYRGLIKSDIDKAIKAATSEKMFFTILKKLGYEYKVGKDISVKPPGKEKYFRLERNLGEGYSLESIKQKIIAQPLPQAFKTSFKPYYRRAAVRRRPKRKIGGFLGLYIRYQYLLGVLPKPSPARSSRAHFLLREDLRHLDRISDEALMLSRNKIQTGTDLYYYRGFLDNEIDGMSRYRKGLVTKKDIDPAEKKKKLTVLDRHIRAYRREISLCDDIFERSNVMRHKLDYIKYEENYNEKLQEVKGRAKVSSLSRER